MANETIDSITGIPYKRPSLTSLNILSRANIDSLIFVANHPTDRWNFSRKKIPFENHRFEQQQTSVATCQPNSFGAMANFLFWHYCRAIPPKRRVKSKHRNRRIRLNKDSSRNRSIYVVELISFLGKMSTLPRKVFIQIESSSEQQVSETKYIISRLSLRLLLNKQSNAVMFCLYFDCRRIWKIAEKRWKFCKKMPPTRRIWSDARLLRIKHSRNLNRE